MESSKYLTIQLDDSFLDRLLGSINVRLNKHEEMIKELQDKLNNLPTREDFQKQEEQFNKNIEEVKKENNNIVSALGAKLNQKIDDLDSNIEATIEEQKRNLQTSLNKQTEFGPVVSENQFRVIEDKLEALQAEVETNAKKQLLTRESVQDIANVIGSISSNHSIKLDRDLQKSLYPSIKYLTDSIRALKEQLHLDSSKDPSISASKSSTESTPKVIERSIPLTSEEKSAIPPPITIPTPSPQLFGSGNLSSRGSKIEIPLSSPIKRASESIIRNPFSSNYDIDLTSIRPLPPISVDWKSQPQLPPIQQFQTLPEAVEYIYSLHQRLQAILNAMHDHMMNPDTKKETIDPAQIAKMIETLKQGLETINGRVDDFEGELEKTATREEINGLVEDLVADLNAETQTAVGRVRCMACGREMTRVAGSMKEEEAARLLGMAPTGYATNTTADRSMQVSYSRRGNLDSGIIESPRSVQGPRKTTVVRLPRTPKK